jgi:hypothetical protein
MADHVGNIREEPVGGVKLFSSLFYECNQQQRSFSTPNPPVLVDSQPQRSLAASSYDLIRSRGRLYTTDKYLRLHTHTHAHTQMRRMMMAPAALYGAAVTN